MKERLAKLGDWQPLPEDALWDDGTQLLVAVPVVGSGPKLRYGKNEGWYYEYHVIKIRCDEDYFALESNGDPWCWDWCDIEWCILLSGKYETSV